MLQSAQHPVCKTLGLTKIMKAKLLVIAIVFFVSCSSGDEKQITNNAFKNVTLDFAEVEAQVPKNYVRTSFDEYERIINESETEQYLKDINLQNINKLRSVPVAIELYLDSSNYVNQIYFQEGEYVKLDKSIAQQYLQVLRGQVEQSWETLGIGYQLKEKKFFSNKDLQVIQIKYKLDLYGSEKYFTQYIISGRRKTIGVMINNKSDIDTEEILKGVKM